MSSQAYIIEIGSDAVGIIVREAGESAFHFHAALDEFHSLEGKTFATPQAAQAAAAAHGARRSRGGLALQEGGAP
jgi:hypothetical protein